MTIGCLGSIPFEVSSKEIKTIRDASWSGSASIQTHQRHLDNALQEFVGVDPDSFTFNIRISKYLGSDPIADVATIFEYERTGTAVPLVIGTKGYGKYRWLVKKHKTTLEHYDIAGDVVGVDLSITLTEYTKG